MGFLFSGALLGSLAAAWPIYLHIRNRRNRRIQVVPSLKLFGFAKKQVRRIRLQQFLLMLARVFFVIALALLLSQAYLETSLELPLPAVADSEPDVYILGMLVDDSLTAHKMAADTSHLQAAAAELSRTIERLPANTRYRIATTTGIYPTPRLHRKEALEFLQTLKPIPQAGDAQAALTELRRALSGQLAALITVGPRNVALWGGLPSREPETRQPLHFLDTTDWPAAVLIQGVNLDASAPVVELLGEADQARNRVLEIHDAAGMESTQTIRAHDALRGRLALKLPDQASHYWHLRLADTRDHPWAHYYLPTSLQAHPPRQIVIFRSKDQAAAIQADQILTAILLSFDPDLSITHVDPENVGSLPQTEVLVIIGAARPTPSLSPWFQQQLQSGVEILTVPLPDQAPVPPTPLIPGWAARQPAPPVGQALKVQVNALPGVDQLVLLGLTELTPSQIIEPRFTQTPTPVLQTATDQVLLAKLTREQHGSTWALGFPLTAGQTDSPIFHPVLPMLISRILLRADGTTDTAVVAEVGDTVDLNEWFQQSRIEGTLHFPNGRRKTVHASRRRPLLIPISQAGTHRLESPGGSLIRLANYPRIDDLQEFSRERWDRERPEWQTIWHDRKVVLRANDFRLFGRDRSLPKRRRRLDLSPVALGLLLGFIMLELLLLLFVWHRRGSVNV